jgi:tetratricopeptide (TPR) repeat protein
MMNEELEQDCCAEDAEGVEDIEDTEDAEEEEEAVSSIRARRLHQLRPPLEPFVGRAGQVEQVAQVLRQAAGQGKAAVALIRGGAGMGKTEFACAVAQELAADMPDAQVWLDMRGSYANPCTAAQGMQQLVHAFDPQAQVAEGSEHVQRRYTSSLQGQRVLVVADDAVSAEQVAPLVVPGGCVLLITTRQQFDVPAAHIEDLPPLDHGASSELVRLTCPQSEAAAPRLAEVCAHVPLALRLCVGMLAQHETLPGSGDDASLQSLATLRDEYLEREGGNVSEAVVQAALLLSYQNLAPIEQAALKQLGVFETSFDLDAAMAVLNLQGVKPARGDEAADGAQPAKQRGRAVPPSVEQVLARLCRLNLVTYEPHEERYGLHPVVRAFALAHLGDALPFYRRRYARYYTDIAADVENLYFQGGEQMLEGLALFDCERVHIEAGWAWACEDEDDNVLLNYVCMIGHTGLLRYHVRDEFLPRAEQALKAAQRLKRRGDECHALNVLGSAYRMLGEPQHALDLYQRALSIFRKVKKLGTEGAVLRNMGNAYLGMGEVQQAVKHYRRSLKLAEKVKDVREQSDALGKLGLAYAEQGELQKAIQYYEQSLGLAREFRYRDFEGELLGNLGVAYIELGQPDEAIRLCEQARTIVCDMGNRRDEGYILNFLGMAYTVSGDYQHANEVAEQALRIAREVGDRRLEGRVLNSLGDNALAQGAVDQAIVFLEQALELAQAVHDRHGEVMSSWNLGRALKQQGDGSLAARSTELMQVRVAYEQAIGHPVAAEHAAQVETSHDVPKVKQ